MSICGLKNDWYKVTVSGTTGYVSSDYLTTAVAMKEDAATSSAGSEIVSYAKKYLGVKYAPAERLPAV